MNNFFFFSFVLFEEISVNEIEKLYQLFFRNPNKYEFLGTTVNNGNVKGKKFIKFYLKLYLRPLPTNQQQNEKLFSNFMVKNFKFISFRLCLVILMIVFLHSCLSSIQHEITNFCIQNICICCCCCYCCHKNCLQA